MVYCSRFGAFAALKTDGSVVTWGLYSATDVSNNLTSGVTSIYPGYFALAALKTDGSVVTWGHSDRGGDSSDVSNNLTSDVSVIYSNYSAFAALKTDGSVVTWGDSGYGGDSSSVSSSLSSGVSVIYSTDSAFAALKDDGSVVTWGNSSYGGDSSTTYGGNLSSGVVAVYFNFRAFAALKTDGSVVTWGNSHNGGNSYVNDGHPNYNNITNVSSSLSSGVVAVYSSNYAFAALKNDGSVVSWGLESFGGDLGKIYDYDYVNSAYVLVSDVSSDLTSGVSKIFSTGHAFAALKNDGSVVTWGYDERGGDSSSVSDQLNP
tara:strand:- start:61 stop:1014 length:954 start_codon:yes stop_codon:yes gene_type:complete